MAPIPQTIANLPGALEPYFLTRKAAEAFGDAYDQPHYQAFRAFLGKGPMAAHALHLLTDPMLPMGRWNGPRPTQTFKAHTWESKVGRLGDSIRLDARDLQPTHMTPEKAAVYSAIVAGFAQAQASVPACLFVEMLVNGYSTTWPIDSQPVLGLHYWDPSNTARGSYRTYHANNVRGGGATKPLTIANIIALYDVAQAYKSPNGLDNPVTYTHLFCSPALYSTAQRYCNTAMLPAAEFYGQTLSSSNAGGDVSNRVAGFGLQVVPVANLPADQWGMVSAMGGMMPFEQWEASPLIWQFTHPVTGNLVGNFLEGLVSPEFFQLEEILFGPRWELEFGWQRPWRMVLCDGAASPTTSITLLRN